MSGYRDRNVARTVDHAWVKSGDRVECAWCGMRPHWVGSRNKCETPTGGRLICTRTIVERPEVEVESVLEGERVVRW